MINKISYAPTRAISFKANDNNVQNYQQVQQPVLRRTELAPSKSDYVVPGFVSYLREKIGDLTADARASRYPARQREVMRSYNAINDYRLNSQPINDIRNTIVRNFKDAREKYFIQERSLFSFYSNPYANPSGQPICTVNPEDANMCDLTYFRNVSSRNYLSEQVYSTTEPSVFFSKVNFDSEGRVSSADEVYDLSSKLLGKNYINNGGSIHYDEVHLFDPDASRTDFNFPFASQLGPVSLINVDTAMDGLVADYMVVYNYDSVNGIKTTRTYVKPKITIEKRNSKNLSFTINAQQILETPYRRANRGNAVKYLTEAVETYSIQPPVDKVQSKTAVVLRNNEATSTSYEDFSHDKLRDVIRGRRTVANIFDVQSKD